jgi:nicotinate phosphoribosyltransferase
MSPHNGYIDPLLTDQYEFTMACSYFCTGRHEDKAVFDLFFRKNPFGGEYTVLAGVSEALRFIDRYRLDKDQIDYLCSIMPRADKKFKKWLADLDCSKVKIYAAHEGSVVFPREPVMRVEGPLALCQLLETTLLNLLSYPSLVATNAARMRLAAGTDKKVVEFGARRAQGPDGAVSAARYSYLGGADGTSNLMAGFKFGIPVSGTQAHSFIQSFSGLDDLTERSINDADGNLHDLVEAVIACRDEMGYGNTNDGELASFIAYAQTFPESFLTLVDTYDTLKSGVPNFLCVAVALAKMGYKPVGIRLDSGDLAYLSKVARTMISEVVAKYGLDLGSVKIVASNEINEATLWSLKHQGHEIDIFGIGTHLVTCQAQPSLGCVYKLVEINDQPRIKLSQEPEKMTIPGRKNVYRLIGRDGHPLADILMQPGEEKPRPGRKILCYHPYQESKRTYITPTKVQPMLELVWDGKSTGDVPDLKSCRDYAFEQIASLRDDHTRLLNPTPYKISLSEKLYEFMHHLWRREAPVGELS